MAELKRRVFLAGSAAAGLGLIADMLSGGAVGMAAPDGIVDAIAVTEVFGDGLRLTAVALRYDRAIDVAGVSPSAFMVAGRTVTAAYANTEPVATVQPRNGRYVIIELSDDDAGARLWGTAQGNGPAAGTGGGPPAAGQAGPAPIIKPAVASVTQIMPVTATDGSVVGASLRPIETSQAVNTVLDRFRQLTFNDPATGETLAYNLFVPADMEPGRRYPLVLFMHDAGVVGAPTIGPLVQGLGAVSWATADDQARHPCFVVAPQYGTVVIDDNYRPTPLFDTTVHLVDHLTDQYPIDPARRYATGQSMGAMMTIGMNIKHPDLFAASYVVAGQWPTDQTGPLADAKLWITVAQGDSKAFPGENDITARAERDGAVVARAVWDGRSTAAQLDAAANAVVGEGGSTNYISFAEGTALPAGVTGGGGSEHMGTWQIAYGIPAIRDWIMAWSRQ